MRYLVALWLLLLADLSSAQGENLIQVEVLSFCSKQYNEYNLVPSEKGAYFLSNRPSIGLKEIKDSQNKYLTSIFFQSNLNARNASVNKIGIKMKYHVGSFCLNKNQDFMIFTTQRSDNDFTLGLFFSQKSGNNWTKPKPLFEKYAGLNMMDPNLSVTGDTLFFAANFIEGNGGTDIYMSVGKLGNWSNVQRLGNNVNSSLNERYPYFFNSKLYFSSTGTMGHGGLDVYSVDLTAGGFDSSPYHFPFPINSDADDFAYHPIDDESGYLSSNRSQDQDDIFLIKTKTPDFECIEYEEPTRCYEFYEEGETDMDTTMYEFEWKFSDGKNYKGNLVNHCFQDTGSYTINLFLVDKVNHERSVKVASYDILIENPDQLEFNIPSTLEKGKVLVLQPSFQKNEETISYYWEFGDGARGYGREVSHIYAKEGQYQIRLGQIIKTANGDEIKKCTSKVITIKN